MSIPIVHMQQINIDDIVYVLQRNATRSRTQIYIYV
jgi:hypothetical protein